MPDDILKKMVDDAIQSVAQRDDATKIAKQTHEAEMKASGQKLRALVLPRLLAAQKAWDGKLKLDITDNSDKFSSGENGVRTNPSIKATVAGKNLASYVFMTHSPGYASVQEGIGANRSTVYKFQVKELSDFTEAKINEVLQDLVNIATGLKTR
jgi:hypothetical protein